MKIPISQLLDVDVSLAERHVASYVTRPRKEKMLALLVAVKKADNSYLLSVPKEDMVRFWNTAYATGDLPMSGVAELRLVLRFVEATRKTNDEEEETKAEADRKMEETNLEMSALKEAIASLKEENKKLMKANADLFALVEHDNPNSVS